MRESSLSGKILLQRRVVSSFARLFLPDSCGKITGGNFGTRAIRNGIAVKQPRLSRSHRANVADIFHGEIKENRVPPWLAAIRHCSARKIDMQIYAQILVISPARPASPCNGSTGVCHPPLTPSSLSRSSPRLPNFIRPLSLSFARSLAIRIVSLYHCARGARSDSENAFFPSRRAPARAGGLRQGVAGGGRRWVRGYKTGLARV